MTDALTELREIADLEDVRERVRAAGAYVNQYTAAEYAARDQRDAHAFAYLDHPKINTVQPGATKPVSEQYGFKKTVCEKTGMAHMTWHRIEKLHAARRDGTSVVAEGRYLRRAERVLPKVRRAADPEQHLDQMREQHAAQAAAHQIVMAGRKVRDEGLRELLPVEASNNALAELAGVDEHTVYLIRAAARKPEKPEKGKKAPVRRGRPPKRAAV